MSSSTGLPYDAWLRQRDVNSVAAMCGFFLGNDPVHHSLQKITNHLDSLGVSYAVADGMALAANGFVRATTDVNVLVTMDGLRRTHEALDGLGYVPPFAGSKHLRDAETNVRVEFLVTGQFPGDGKPKPVAFPDPAEASFEKDGIRYLKLDVLLELKLASGMTNRVGSRTWATSRN